MYQLRHADQHRHAETAAFEQQRHADQHRHAGPTVPAACPTPALLTNSGTLINYGDGLFNTGALINSGTLGSNGDIP